MANGTKIVQLEDYEKLVGAETIDRIHKKAKSLQGLHVVNVNSTYYGGGVAELLSSMSLLMNSVGIKTGWRIIQGAPDFFSITKKMHNATYRDEINLSDRKMEIYEEVIEENVLKSYGLKTEEMAREFIRESGFTPVRRDFLYHRAE